MLERLELIPSGCVGKSALKSDRVKSLDENWETLEQKGVLTVIWYLRDAPSKVVEKLESLADNNNNCYYYDYYYEYYY